MAPPRITNQRRRRHHGAAGGPSMGWESAIGPSAGSCPVTDPPAGPCCGERPVDRLRNRWRSRARPFDRLSDRDPLRDQRRRPSRRHRRRESTLGVGRPPVRKAEPEPPHPAAMSASGPYARRRRRSNSSAPSNSTDPRGASMTSLSAPAPDGERGARSRRRWWGWELKTNAVRKPVAQRVVPAWKRTRRNLSRRGFYSDPPSRIGSTMRDGCSPPKWMRWRPELTVSWCRA